MTATNLGELEVVPHVLLGVARGVGERRRLVERMAELRIVIADEEPDGKRTSIEVEDEISGLLGDPRVGQIERCGRMPSTTTASAPIVPSD
jgi:hypothetical protein